MAKTFPIPGSGLELTLWAPDIVRVRFGAPAAESQSPDWVVGSPLEATKGEVFDDGFEWRLETPALSIRYHRAEDRLSFYDRRRGCMVLRETTGARDLPAAQIGGEYTRQPTQRFESPDRERLMGLGQQPDGHLDFKGLFACLVQYNVINAMPFLLSSEGYGILWNNASRTELNPGRHPLPLRRDPYTQTWETGFTPEESGLYQFIFEKTNRNRALEPIRLRVGEKEIIQRETPWHPAFYTGLVSLEAGRTVPVLLDGTGELSYRKPSERNVTTFFSEAGEAVDYFFFLGPSPHRLVAAYREVTGRAPLFARWAYGYWQSRERYANAGELMAVAREYRSRGLPLDVIVQDWQYWGDYGWNALKFHPDLFPDMAKLTGELHQMGVRLMATVWPNFGQSPHSEVYREMSAGGFLMDDAAVREKMGGYKGDLQGFQSNYYDAFDPRARALLWKHMKRGLLEAGVDAWWLDGCEPNLTSVPGVFHHYQTCRGPAFKNLNAYPLLHAKGIYENQRKDSEGKRVFMLARTAFLGQQHVASAVWSGDSYGTWGEFRRQIVSALQMSLSGMPYWTCDIGGFLGGDPQSEAYRELYTRWFQFGAFCPLFRAHGTKSPREVWQFGEGALAVLSDFLRLRYRLLPTIYSLAHQVTHHHGVFLRPLSMDFPGDGQAVVVGNQMMFGPSLMVCPVTEPGARQREVYFPQGDWYDFWTGARLGGGQVLEVPAPLEKCPLFVRAGSLLVLGEETHHTDPEKTTHYEIHIYPGADGHFVLYEDEGDSYRYEKGAFCEISLDWQDELGLLRVGAPEGAFSGMTTQKTLTVVCHVPPAAGKTTRQIATYQGRELLVAFPNALNPAGE